MEKVHTPKDVPVIFTRMDSINAPNMNNMSVLARPSE